MSETALVFVEPILTGFREAAKAEHSALKSAIACGKAAILAKENVEAEQGTGKWTAWRETNLSIIPQTTLSLYMRLARNEDLITDAESIRAAIEKLPKQPRGKPGGESESDSGGEGEGEEAEGEELDDATDFSSFGRSTVSDDLADLLPVVSADDVFPIIRQCWNEEELNKLAGYLDSYLAQPLALAS